MQEKQQYDVTEQLVSDLSELIVDPKMEVKKGVLNILMQCLGNEENRAKFEDSPVFLKTLMNFVSEEGLETAALTCLIQFSSDTWSHEQLKDLNLGDRLVNSLKDLIEDVVKRDFVITQRDALIIQLSTLVLVNFTQSLMGKNSFLSLDREDDQQGMNIMIMMKILANQKTAQMVKYFSNVIVNISSYDTGRKLLVQQQNEFLETCLPYVLFKQQNIRTGISKAIRNCIFEYEDEEFIQYLFSEKIDFMNTICKGILLIINQSQHLSYKGCKQGEKSEKIAYVCQEKLKQVGIDLEKSKLDLTPEEDGEIAELFILIDSLLVLTNVDFKQFPPHQDKALVSETIEILKNVKFSEEISDKIEVIATVYN